MNIPAGKPGHFDQYTNKTHLAYTKMHRPLLDQCHLCMNALMMLEVLDQNPKCRTPKELGRVLGLKSNILKRLGIDHFIWYINFKVIRQEKKSTTKTC